MIERARLIRCVEDRYRQAGPYAMHFARSKLRRDPVYFNLLELGVVGPGVDILDLGCGQGILLALLAAAADCGERSAQSRLFGVDVDPRAIRRARAALGERAEVMQADIARSAFPRSQVVVLLDMLHYLPHHSQEQVLERAARALSPRGQIVMRVCDPQRTFRAAVTVLSDRLAALLRGERWRTYHLRTIPEWTALLDSLGLSTSSMPMSQGTPFANVLLIGRKP